MYALVEKQKENKGRAVANSVTQKKSNVKQGFGFVNNRPEAARQLSLQRSMKSASNSIEASPATQMMWPDLSAIGSGLFAGGSYLVSAAIAHPYIAGGI